MGFDKERFKLCFRSPAVVPCNKRPQQFEKRFLSWSDTGLCEFVVDVDVDERVPELVGELRRVAIEPLRELVREELGEGCLDGIPK